MSTTDFALQVATNAPVLETAVEATLSSFSSTDATANNLLFARLQMAFTLGAHIVLACLGVGLPVLMLVAEGLALRGVDPIWRVLAKRWAKAFAVLFAVGAVSGTVLSFELGLLWPKFMGTFGSVIGLPFTLEGFAFFMEAIFAGIYLYGWDRLSKRAHWLCGIPIAVSGLASAWFVVTANAWMNSPQGFELDASGVVTEADPLVAMFNAATWPQSIHMIVAAYMVTGFLVAAFYATRLAFLRKSFDSVTQSYHRKAMGLALALAGVASVVQPAVGHWAGHMVATSQPVKLAAMEGQFQTERRAPLRIGGLPDLERMQTVGAIEIPGGLSWIAHGDWNAEVQGLEDFPRENWPPVRIVHIAFQLMIGAGMALLGLSAWVAWSLVRKRELPRSSLFLVATIGSGPLSVLALQTGWIVTEVGRQPWIVQGVMRTREAVTTAPGIATLFGITIGIYVILFVGCAAVLRILARQPLPHQVAAIQAQPAQAK